MAREILSSAVYCRKSPSGFYAFSEALVEESQQKTGVCFLEENLFLIIENKYLVNFDWTSNFSQIAGSVAVLVGCCRLIWR